MIFDFLPAANEIKASWNAGGEVILLSGTRWTSPRFL